ncbi:adenylyltransferase/cytidyltransferase family protein [bacterium SCSIO 12741]|nr:adenylyltransferase/cytidyltransferase family protein [bacterium SCSIO 12741]
MRNLDRVKGKVLNAEHLRKQIKSWQELGDQVVFTNGVFDLLHAGHIDYLANASDLGQRLVIGVNSDESVRQLNKGPARPIKDEDSRALILASLEFVSGVVIFGEDTPYELLQILQPDVLVKGGDYDPAETDRDSKAYIVGSDLVRNRGGRVEALAFLPGHSTTRLEQKIKNAN